MNDLFSRLRIADIHQDVIRNIVSIRDSQDLFDDLSNDAEDWALAQQVEDEAKPPVYRSGTPIIHRPFEDAQWFNAIAWPFKHWQSSRFSDGSYGVWYGCHSVEATLYESAYHWYRGLLCDAGFEKDSVIGERKLYTVTCDAALLDFRGLGIDYPALLHKSDYSFAQSVGARIHREGHPGLVVQSARYFEGENYVVFNPDVLSNPQFNCQLTYRVDGGNIIIKKSPGTAWLVVPIVDL